MTFPLGKPLLVMGVVAILTGGWICLRPAPPRKDLTLWVFATSHFQEYDRILAAPSARQVGKSVNVELTPTRAMDMRLPVLFMAPGSARELPDAVEVATSSMGLYLRPPAEQVGFLPLNDYLKSSGDREIDSLDAPGRRGWNARLKGDRRVYTFDGRRWLVNPNRSVPDAWIDRLLPSRLASATRQGVIFGVPHDVHPVALAFRDDLFREAGVPLIDDAGRSTVATWGEFQEKCLQFQSYWRGRGETTRHAIELPRNNAGMLSILLAQQRVSLVGPNDGIHLNDKKVAETLAFYAGLVAGDRSISAEAAADSGLEYRDFADGHLCAALMPDWKVDSFRQYAPGLAGKMRMIPLPRFDARDAPTASYGGTLICIPRGAAHPDDSWRLIEYLYFSPAGLDDRRKLGILPPLPEEWDKAEYHQPDAYFGGQKSLELYTDLAREAPPDYSTPVNAMALLMLGYVQSRAVGYVAHNGTPGLEGQCQAWLDDAAADLQRRIDHARFER